MCILILIMNASKQDIESAPTQQSMQSLNIKASPNEIGEKKKLLGEAAKYNTQYSELILDPLALFPPHPLISTTDILGNDNADALPQKHL